MASILELPTRLNRRHKAVLFATLLVSGFILVAGGGIGAGLGCILLGIALAWAVGCNSRAVHWFFVVVGLLLLLTPVMYFRIENWQQRDFARNGQPQVDWSTFKPIESEPSVDWNNAKPIDPGGLRGHADSSGAVTVQGPDGKIYLFPAGTDKQAAVEYFKKKKHTWTIPKDRQRDHLHDGAS